MAIGLVPLPKPSTGDPFLSAAQELFPGVWRPTPAHYFMRLLHAKGLLLRCYTQVTGAASSVAMCVQACCVERSAEAAAVSNASGKLYN